MGEPPDVMILLVVAWIFSTTLWTILVGSCVSLCGEVRLLVEDCLVNGGAPLDAVSFPLSVWGVPAGWNSSCPPDGRLDPSSLPSTTPDTFCCLLLPLAIGC